MKHSKIYTHLGIAGALLIPALAVAAVEIPNVFQGGDPVSASEMNENFEAMAEAIETLEVKVETLENAGLQVPIELDEFAAPLTELVVIYQVHTDGVMTVRPVGSGWPETTVRLDTGTSPEAALDCVDSDTASCALGRGIDGNSASVLLPAGHYIAVQVDQLENTAQAKIIWQPLHGPDPAGKEPTRVSSSH